MVGLVVPGLCRIKLYVHGINLLDISKGRYVFCFSYFLPHTNSPTCPLFAILHHRHQSLEIWAKSPLLVRGSRQALKLFVL